MTTQEIADRLVALCREGNFAQVYAELYAPHAKSIEPPHAAGLQSVEGLHNFAAKGEAFNAQFEAFHSSYVNDAIVAGDYFALATGFEATHKTAGRMHMEEIALYHVQDGKIVSEQFFY